jgi:hypothetical protein
MSVHPEEMSLTAHQHIKQYLVSETRTTLSDYDLTAVLRLSQHLRVFGLLSAAGYVNQSNAQGGEVRERTVPVWLSLLGQMLGEMIDLEEPSREDLKEAVVKLARNQPQEYMAAWRRSLILANHWNFWARAYQE